MMMSSTSPDIVAQMMFRIISFVTALLILGLGIMLLAGPIMATYVPSNYRIILGIVMVIYGAYRIVMVWMKQRNASRLQE